jgi:hypothetical protein
MDVDTKRAISAALRVFATDKLSSTPTIDLIGVLTAAGCRAARTPFARVKFFKRDCRHKCLCVQFAR